MEKKSRGHGSFCISMKAVNMLLANKATALQIGAYLTLARFTSDDNRFSTASLKAIYNATGASNMKGGTAERVVDEICKIKSTDWHDTKRPYVLYPAASWAKSSKEALPEIPHGLHRVHYVVNDFGDDRKVWFPNSLVDGIGKFTQPLKRLRQLGDVAARLLLLMYARHDMIEHGGLPPYHNVYQAYKTIPLSRNFGCSFWRAEATTPIVSNQMAFPALGITEWPDKQSEEDKQESLFFDALQALDTQGFINEVVTVMDRAPDKPDGQPLYILHTKERHGEADTSLDLAEFIDTITEEITGTRAADSLGRFNGKYSAIVVAGEIHVVGIYRLRFRISNKRNHGISQAWERMREDHSNMIEVLRGLCDRADGTQNDR